MDATKTSYAALIELAKRCNPSMSEQIDRVVADDSALMRLGSLDVNDAKADLVDYLKPRPRKVVSRYSRPKRFDK